MTHEERARAAILQWYAETEQYFSTIAEEDEPLVHLLAEALAAVEREARVDERERGAEVVDAQIAIAKSEIKKWTEIEPNGEIIRQWQACLGMAEKLAAAIRGLKDDA